MKNLKLLSIPILLMTMLLGFDACKSKDVTPASIIGKWKWTAVNNRNTALTTDFVDASDLQKVLNKEVFDFKANNTYSVTNWGDGDYELKDNILTLDNLESGPVVITETTMTLKITDWKIDYVFTRQ
jgi:hypothetical protein